MDKKIYTYVDRYTYIHEDRNNATTSKKMKINRVLSYKMEFEICIFIERVRNTKKNSIHLICNII